MSPHWITSLTIWLALLGMATWFLSRIRPELVSWESGRLAWTAGCLAFIGHVLAAFAFHHHWSHANAFQVTAERTHEMLGVRFGEGIYFSYLFGIIWISDVIWQWSSPSMHRHRSHFIDLFIVWYLAFIAFNGAVIFEGGATRWLGLPVAAILVGLALRSRFAKTEVATETSSAR